MIKNNQMSTNQFHKFSKLTRGRNNLESLCVWTSVENVVSCPENTRTPDKPQTREATASEKLKGSKISCVNQVFDKTHPCRLSIIFCFLLKCFMNGSRVFVCLSVLFLCRPCVVAVVPYKCMVVATLLYFTANSQSLIVSCWKIICNSWVYYKCPSTILIISPQQLLDFKLHFFFICWFFKLHSYFSTLFYASLSATCNSAPFAENCSQLFFVHCSELQQMLTC